MMSSHPTAAFPFTRTTPTIISPHTIQPASSSLQPSIPHHTLSSSPSPPSSASNPSFFSSFFTPRTVLLSAAAVTSAALLVYYLRPRYAFTSRFPFLHRRSSPLSDPLTGVHFLADLRRYSSAGVHVLRPAAFFDLRAALVRDGPSHLQLITDFDHTLSSYSSLSSHGTLESSSSLPPSYAGQVQALFQRYYPIEMDLSIAPEVKATLMVEWWEAAHALLISHHFNRAFIQSAVAEARQRSRLRLRQGAEAVLRYCGAAQVPVLVFSAGLGDCIDEFLRQEGLLAPHVDVVSNWMRFDEGGRLVGFEADLIHSLNKDYEHVQRQRQRGQAVVQGMEAPHRKNVILLGDSVGDVRMVHGLEDVDTLLKVGFVNGEPTEAKLEKYREVYDVLIVDRGQQLGTMDFVLELLHIIAEPAAPR